MKVNGWSVAAAVLACACQAASPGGGTAEPPPSTPGAAPAPLASTSASEDVPSVDALQAIAPELSARSAARLIEAFGRSGQTAEAVAEAGLATASQGFRTLDDATVREAGAVLAEAYATLAPADRVKLGSYLDRVRSGDAVGDARDGRRLFAQAVANLGSERRSRLQELFEQGIFAGLQYESEARERTLAAQPVEVGTAPPEPARTSLVAGPQRGTAPGVVVPSPARLEAGGAPKGRGEAYWRAEAQRRRERVSVLERELAEAEAAGARFVYSSDESDGQMGFGTPTPNPFYVARAKANARIAQLRSQLASAKQRLSELDDDARRDSAMPGWLR